MMRKEVFREVVGFENEYEVSDRGTVRSLDKTISYINFNGHTVTYQHFGQTRLPKPAYVNGRLKRLDVALCRNGKKTWRTVHSLVMEAFVGPRPEGMQIAHNDGQADNNRVSNLRYDTARGNCADRWRHGTIARGMLNGRAKLTDNQARTILRSKGAISARFLADQFDVTKHTIYSIWTRRKWRHIV